MVFVFGYLSYPSFRVALRVCAEQRWETHTAGEYLLCTGGSDVCYDVTQTVFFSER